MPNPFSILLNFLGGKFPKLRGFEQWAPFCLAWACWIAAGYIYASWAGLLVITGSGLMMFVYIISDLKS